MLASAGQVALDPVHTSFASHEPVELRQSVPAVTNPSAGQAWELPLHLSAVSHTPEADRHVVAEVAN